MDGVGKFYGIGVGPGDPELLTLRAVKVVREVDVVFAAGSAKNGHSIAESIIRPHLPEGKEVERLPVPMTLDGNLTSAAYVENAQRVWDTLAQGKDAAFLTLGDPLTYSTMVYLFRALKELRPDVEVEIVPGITSFAAAAAAVQMPLVEHEESLLVVSGARGGQRLKEQALLAKNVVVLKAYKQFDDIKASLEKLGMAETAVLVSRTGLTGEKVVSRLKDQTETPPYLSLIIAKDGRHRDDV